MCLWFSLLFCPFILSFLIFLFIPLEPKFQPLLPSSAVWTGSQSQTSLKDRCPTHTSKSWQQKFCPRLKEKSVMCWHLPSFFISFPSTQNYPLLLLSSLFFECFSPHSLMWNLILSENRRWKEEALLWYSLWSSICSCLHYSWHLRKTYLNKNVRDSVQLSHQ